MAEKNIETSETPARAVPPWAEGIIRNRKKIALGLIIGIPILYYVFLYEPPELTAANYLREVCKVPEKDYPFSDYYYLNDTNEYIIRFKVVENAFGIVYNAALNLSNWSQYACDNETPVNWTQYNKIIIQRGEAAKEEYDAYLREIYARYGITENNTSGQT